jgi:transcription elongation factor Elf1
LDPPESWQTITRYGSYHLADVAFGACVRLRGLESVVCCGRCDAHTGFNLLESWQTITRYGSYHHLADVAFGACVRLRCLEFVSVVCCGRCDAHTGFNLLESWQTITRYGSYHHLADVAFGACVLRLRGLEFVSVVCCAHTGFYLEVWFISPLGGCSVRSLRSTPTAVCCFLTPRWRQ